MINAISSVLTCLHIVTSSKSGLNIICTKLRQRNLEGCYLLWRRNVASHRVNFTNFVEFIAKTEEFVVLM